MTTTRPGIVLRRLRDFVTAEGARTAPDRQLLRRFVRGRDESAFAALVRRHGPLVLGVCRRVLHHEQDAEDAFQATFLVLARKAAGLERGRPLGGGLYRVAYHMAINARKQAAARRRREVAGVAAARPTVAMLEVATISPGVARDQKCPGGHHSYRSRAA